MGIRVLNATLRDTDESHHGVHPATPVSSDFTSNFLAGNDLKMSLDILGPQGWSWSNQREC